MPFASLYARAFDRKVDDSMKPAKTASGLSKRLFFGAILPLFGLLVVCFLAASQFFGDEGSDSPLDSLPSMDDRRRMMMENGEIREAGGPSIEESPADGAADPDTTDGY